MSITSFSLARQRFTLVTVLVLLVAGGMAYVAMPQQMDPGFIVRTAQIVTVFPGASPDRVEALVTDPIEQAVQAVPELDFVTSTSRTGVSVVAVNLREEFTDIRPIWDSLRRKVDRIKADLPAGVIGPDINDELGDIYPMLFSLTADGFSARETTEIAETIRDQLLRMKGVAKVEILGEQEERVFVEYSSTRLAQLGISPGQLAQALQGRNIILPGGQIDIGAEALVLEPSGSYESVEEIARTLVQLPTGGVTYLGDLADVRRGTIDPPRGLVTVEGAAALTLAISMADGDNLVALGAEVREFFDDLPRRYPHGIDFELSYFQPAEVQTKVDEFMGSVLQAVGIVLAVMLLTLGVRTGFVVSTLIPATMVIAIWVLSLIGETINQMSLAALIIALGLLVDNAIVVSEAILVSISRGVRPRDAAIQSCKELQVPLLISSLTTAAAFLPIYLSESSVGEYTGLLFTVVGITLLISWLLAITVTPGLCARFLRPPKESQGPESRLSRLYGSALDAALRRRYFTLALALAAFVGSLQLWQFVPAVFFPPQDSPFFMASFNLPPGANIEATQEVTARVDQFIARELEAREGAEGVTSWTTFIGETPPPFKLGYAPSPSLGGYSELMVHTSSVAAVEPLMDRLTRFAAAEFPDVQTHIRKLSNGPPVDKPVQIRISSDNRERAFEVAAQVEEKLADVPGLRNIDNDWGPRVKKLSVTVDEPRAQRASVTNEDVAQALRSFLTGTQATLYREQKDSIPVLLRSTGTDRRNLDRVRNLTVFSKRGTSVPLSQVADISLAWEPSAILRRNRYQTVTVRADLEGSVTALSAFAAIEPWLEETSRSWDLGTRWEFGGEYESSVKANQAIGEKVPIGALVIVLLLVAQFNSLRKTAIVLSTIVLALIGVVLGLIAMGSTFGFMTLLGVVSLAGIVINNAIVLLDRIQLEIEEGRHPFEAVRAAAKQRVRPILLTTATTIASLIPLYLSGGAMWEPMAVAIMFGLAFSTVLTLLIVPALYCVAYRVPMPEASAGLAGARPGST